MLAALNGPPGTTIVSNDAFKDYFALIPDRSNQILFYRWLMSHKIKHRASEMLKVKYLAQIGLISGSILTHSLACLFLGSLEKSFECLSNSGRDLAYSTG